MPNPPKKVIDTRSGRIFLALNQCYLALLREGELEEMRRAGRLRENPEEDTFGYYRMRRFYPGRFVQEDDTLRWARTIDSLKKNFPGIQVNRNKGARGLFQEGRREGQ